MNRLSSKVESDAADRESLSQLVLDCQKGASTFEELVRRSQRHARNLACSLVGPNNCEDILQESYLLAFQKIHQLKDPRAFMAWLCRIVIHRSQRFLERNSTQAEDLESLPVNSREDGFSDQLVGALILKKALAKLKPWERNILILRELLSLSYEEISHTLQIPLGTVRSRLSSARKSLSGSVTGFERSSQR